MYQKNLVNFLINTLNNYTTIEFQLIWHLNNFERKKALLQNAARPSSISFLKIQLHTLWLRLH